MKKSECKFENNPDLKIKSFVGQAKLILATIFARSAYYVGDGSKIGCLSGLSVWFVRNFGDFCGRDMGV